MLDKYTSVSLNLASDVIGTVAILAQGTSWAVAVTQAFCATRLILVAGLRKAERRAFMGGLPLDSHAVDRVKIRYSLVG